MARSLLLVMGIILTTPCEFSLGNSFQRVSESYDLEIAIEMIEKLEAPAAGNKRNPFQFNPVGNSHIALGKMIPC